MQNAPYPPPVGPQPYRPPAKKSNAGRIFLGITSVLMGLVSMPCTVLFIVMAVEGATDVGGAIFLALFCAMMSAVSVGMFWLAVRKKKKPPFVMDEWRERQTLQLAKQHGGLLSVGALALNSDMSVEESVQALETLEQRGIASTWVDDHGDLVYRFAALSSGPVHAQHQGTPPNASMRDLDAFDRELRAAQSEHQFDFGEQQGADAPQHHQQHASHAHPNKKSGS